MDICSYIEHLKLIIYVHLYSNNYYYYISRIFRCRKLVLLTVRQNFYIGNAIDYVLSKPVCLKDKNERASRGAVAGETNARKFTCPLVGVISSAKKITKIMNKNDFT